ncbi:hypothetical protein ACPDHL_09630 [Myroides sp. C15-4]|uniref:hypothetical protein n=1 Tax=Myroides sp. C15-4 TaxID=3400532 RepID=UPI003D2F61F5
MKQRLFFSKINQENVLTLEDKLINTSSICIINKDYDVKCLRKLNELLVKYSEILVLYEIETKKLLEEGDLSALQYLSNVQNLCIAVNMGIISTLDQLGNIKHLERLELMNRFKKGISLEVLNKFTTLKYFRIESGITNKQHQFLNIQNSLEILRASSLDLSKLSINPFMKILLISKELKSGELLNAVFPNLRTLMLERCNKLNLEDTISSLDLKAIRLGHISTVEKLPIFKYANNIELFQCVGLKKLTDVNSIFSMTNLKALMITELVDINADIFIERLKELKFLEVAYITFKNSSESDRIYNYCCKNGLHFKQPGLVDSKRFGLYAL